jgi:hypothetical protein
MPLKWELEECDCSKSNRNIIEPHLIRNRNMRGNKLIDCRERNGFVITNTWFKTPKRKLNSKLMGGGGQETEIDIR